MHARELHTDQPHNLLQQSSHAEPPDTAGVGSPELLPDAVLPEQFYGFPRNAVHTQSEVALIRAVLDDALNCYQKQFITNTQRERRLAREAEEWLFSDHDRWAFSFVNVCHALGLEPEYLRRGLKRWRHRPLAEPQRRQRRTIPPRRLLRVAA